MKDRVVIVGARADNGEAEFDIHGPFELHDAQTFQEGIESVWEKQPTEAFIHGKQFVYIMRLREDETHPFYTRAALAAKNWYEEQD